MPFLKGRLYYADWRDAEGRRRRKSFPTLATAADWERRQKALARPHPVTQAFEGGPNSMATLANSVSVEEYLHNPEWERCEYVDGVIEERGMPTSDHSAWMQAICLWFGQHAVEWNIRVRPEYTNRANETRYRIPDVSIIDFHLPKESSAAITPPIAPFEIWSPDDRISRVLRGLNDLEKMGVAQIWLVDPADGVWQRFNDGRLAVCEDFQLAERKIHFPMDAITKLVR